MPEEIKKSAQTFTFYTRLSLSELTGLKASTLPGLLELIKEAPGSCIYHHTHRFLQQHQYLSPEPPNDFAHWVTEALGEEELGESLASIDTIQFNTIRALRDKIAETIEEYMEENPKSASKSAAHDEEFYFIKSVSFAFSTKYVAHDLKEFEEILHKVSINSIYFHMFEARLRLEKGTNDFSFWVESSFQDKKLADDIARLDPYTYTMEDLRKALIRTVRKRIGI